MKLLVCEKNSVFLNVFLVKYFIRFVKKHPKTYQKMTNFIIIAIAICTGILFRRYKNLPKDSHRVINLWIVNIALPAIALRYIPKMNWNWDVMLILSTPVIIYIGAFLVIALVSKFRYIPLKSKAAILLTVGFSNMSFLGYPITETYYGIDGLKLAILCDQASFIVVSSLGILTATYASQGKGKLNIKDLFVKVFTFPPTLAFILAFALPYFTTMDSLDGILSSLGATMVPMALFSIGLQLEFKHWKADKQLLSIALIYKLLLAPLLVFGISWFFIIEKLYVQVSVIEAAMAPMVVGTIIATEFGLNPKLSNMILSFGIPISLGTTFLWYLVLNFV